MFNKIKNLCAPKHKSIEDLLQTYQPEIEAIKSLVANDPFFEKRYMPCIKRFLEYVYLLPASKHGSDGGLALYGLQKAIPDLKFYLDKRQLSNNETTSEDSMAWGLSVFLVTLSDAANKVFSMDIFIEEPLKNKRIQRTYWRGIEEALFHFLTKNKQYTFKVAWEKNQDERPNMLVTIALRLIAEPETLEYLGIIKVSNIMQVISPEPDSNNLIRPYLEATKATQRQKTQTRSIHSGM